MSAAAPAWLLRELAAAPRRFGLLTVAVALPHARLRGPRSLAPADAEVEGIDGDEVRTAVLGLAGAQSPLPAALARELAALDPACAMSGLLQAIEDRLLRLLVQAQVRRAVDDPAAHRATLHRLAGPQDDAEAAIIGRTCDGRTADALAARLALAAGCGVRVVAATGGGLPLGPGRTSTLGLGSLGADLAVGERVSAPELGCRIELGPVDADVAGRLRPGGDRHAELLSAIARGVPPCLVWRLELLLRPGPAGEALGRDLRLAGDPPLLEREELARSVA